MRVLGENTPITVGFAIVIMGGIVTVALIGAQTAANTQEIKEVRAKQDAIYEMKADVAVIRSQVEDIRKKMEARK